MLGYRMGGISEDCGGEVGMMGVMSILIGSSRGETPSKEMRSWSSSCVCTFACSTCKVSEYNLQTGRKGHVSAVEANAESVAYKEACATSADDFNVLEVKCP